MNRFADVIGKAGHQAAQPVRLRRVAGHRNNRNLGALLGRLALPEPPKRLEAVQAGHSEVQQNQVELPVQRALDGLFGIGLDDCAMAQQGQQMSLHRAGQRIVVDHRDAGRRSLLGRTRFRFVHHRPRPAHGVPAGEIYPKRLRVEAKSRAPWSAAVQPPAGELGFVRVDRGWRGFRGGSLGLAGGRMRARLAQALGLLLLSLRLLALALFKSVIGLGQLVS